MRKNIAVDFDGVIHKYSKGWQSGEIYDAPIEGALEALLKLKTEYNVIIFTTRENTEAVRTWLKAQWKETTLNKDELALLMEIEITNKKPIAIAYIDDRAIRFTNWTDILKYFR